ncbi:MAG: gliding motility-associated C-terminal domain-containing protein [Bacteroidetes bacterium]|nr:gliding motility-associated C-terminal domain-containing protein [Bacteroidota bacterium]
MKHFIYSFLLALFICVGGWDAKAQLVVETVGSAEELAQSLVGGGVTISNVQLNCPDGGWGSFDGTDANVGMNDGIILASGDITNAVGPNLEGGITTDFQASGDPDLDALSGFTTYDACVLEFDLQTTGDSLKFNYVFGSDEYSEFVNSPFNDIFAFLISGPGIIGEQNIALVPGTSTPVAINTVNCLNGSVYYICNDPYNFLCPGSYDCPDDPNTTSVEYDGFTTVLTAKVAVQPCETYHLKLAVADASDHVLDSGVLIQGGSLSSSGTSVSVNTGYLDPNSSTPAIVEGCFTGQFNFVITNPPSDTSFIYYEIAGTAINGTDYSQIPDSLMVLPGDTSVSLTINSFNDGFPEGFETVVLYLYLPCSPVPYDSATMVILDTLIAVAEPDTAICIGQDVQLSSNGAQSWFWAPGSGLNCNTCQNPVATPLVTTTYTVTITVAGCTATSTVTVIVDNPLPVVAGPDVAICSGGSIQLNAVNGNSYTWFPPVGLSCTDCANPVASPPSTTTYVVTGINGCFTTSDTITVVVNPNPVATASDDVTICPGDTVQLNSSGGVNYSWSPSDGLSDPSSPNPFAVVFNTTTFTVLVENEFGCTDTENVTINVYNTPDVVVSSDTTIYLGNSVDLEASGGVSYQWVPPTYLSDPNSPFPTSVLPQDTITYYVTVTSADGCQTTDSVTIYVRWDALVAIPSAFSPNSDGHNDILHLLVRGIFDLNHFYVYNRWGELVFETTDVNNGWDGTYKGKEQPVGVYVYTYAGTDHDGRSINGNGSVTLVR